MSKTKLETAKELAKAHYALEPYLRVINLIEPINEQDPKDPIKLLEVVEGTIECGIEPVGFGPDPSRGIDYPSWIVEVSPTEYKAILGGTLQLRDAWKVGEELPRG